MQNFKEELLQECIYRIQQKNYVLIERINSLQNDLTTATKSSAGDKHETTRAMIQLEIEKAGNQLKEIQQSKLVLDRINSITSSKIVSLGSIVETSLQTYFISISLGEITINAKTVFAVSTYSPIGKLLLGKKELDFFIFQGKKIQINKIS